MNYWNQKLHEQSYFKMKPTVYRYLNQNGTNFKTENNRSTFREWTIQSIVSSHKIAERIPNRIHQIPVTTCHWQNFLSDVNDLLNWFFAAVNPRKCPSLSLRPGDQFAPLNALVKFRTHYLALPGETITGWLCWPGKSIRERMKRKDVNWRKIWCWLKGSCWWTAVTAS